MRMETASFKIPVAHDKEVRVIADREYRTRAGMYRVLVAEALIARQLAGKNEKALEQEATP